MNNEELKNIIVEELQDIFKSRDIPNILRKFFYEHPDNCDCAGLLNLCQIWANDKSKNLLESISNEIAGNILNKLPEQIITEDRIIEVLSRFHVIINPKYSYKQIASEILQGQGWEVIKGVLGYSCYSFYLNKSGEEDIVLDNILNKYKGKNIEIVVRERGKK